MSLSTALRVILPDELADELIDEGFEEGGFRGALADAGIVMSIVTASLAVGAKVSAILVSRDELDAFAAAVRRWIRRKAAAKPDEEVTIDISARNGDDVIHAQVKVEFTGGAPDIDTEALAAFMNSLLLPGRAIPDASAAPE